MTPDRGASPADQSRHTLSGKDHHQYPALNGVADSLLGLPFRCLPSPGCYSRASPPLNVRCLTFLFPSFLHRMPLKCPDQAPTSKRQRTTKIEVPEDGVDHLGDSKGEKLAERYRERVSRRKSIAEEAMMIMKYVGNRVQTPKLPLLCITSSRTIEIYGTRGCLRRRSFDL